MADGIQTPSEHNGTIQNGKARVIVLCRFLVKAHVIVHFHSVTGFPYPFDFSSGLLAVYFDGHRRGPCGLTQMESEVAGIARNGIDDFPTVREIGLLGQYGAIPIQL